MKDIVKKIARKMGFDLRRFREGHPTNDYVQDVLTRLGSRQVSAIFDIGANNGETALLLAERLKPTQLFAFEPTPNTYEALVRATRDRECIRPVRVALGNATGVREFTLRKGADLNSFLSATAEAAVLIDSTAIAQEGVVPVNMTTLDEFRQKEAIARIDLVKIDTQGFELSVLQGARQSLNSGVIGAVLLEVNFVPLYRGQPTFSEILDFLSDCGFRFVSFYQEVFAAEGNLKWADALFIHVPRSS